MATPSYEVQQDIEIFRTETEGKRFHPDWRNEPTIRDLKQDFEDARPAHGSQVRQINSWLDNLHVRGAAAIPKRKGRSSIVPRLIRKQAEWRYSALTEPFLSNDDIFQVNPVTFEDKMAAMQNQLVLNNQFNTQIGKTKFIDEYVRAAVDEGTVIVRTGWDYEEQTIKRIEPVYEFITSSNPDRIQEFEQYKSWMQNDPVSYQSLDEDDRLLHEMSMQSGQALERVQTGVQEIEEIIVVKNQPTAEVCDFNNVVIDPTCEGNMEKAKFVIFSFETSLSELEKDGKYKNLGAINIEGTSVLNEPDHNTQDDSAFQFTDKPRKKFVAREYWGFWDIDGSGVVKPIVATWVGDVMIRLEENPFPKQELPFVVVQYLPVRKSIYGEPDGSLLEDNQRILGAVTRGVIDMMGRSANGQIGMRKDALDVTNKRKYDAGLDYEFNAPIDPRNAIIEHKYPEIPRSAEFMINLQNADAESLTGVKAFTGGISGSDLGETAYGARNALDAASKRELGILRRLAQGIKEVGRKMIAYNSEFLSEEEVIRITNEKFVKVRRDDLAGNFDLKLSISTAEADNQKAQELSFMLQTMGNNMDVNLSKMILSDIATLRNMPELAKRIEAYQPQPDPLAQKKAELEIQLLEAQIANEMAKANENQVDVRLKGAKAQTEEAKARKLHSESDQKDLDFVEQQGGVTHGRDMDKLDHGRGTQLDLKVADSLLAEDKQTGNTSPISSSNPVQLPDSEKTV